ncbi:MAG: tripartite tricarboxylate transporter permease [Deltaproteobacteria bacterium]|nr:tripartite tricarboxylate transporter permease [Deltaproteobacteria bacterium]
MVETFAQFLYGIQVALSPENLFYCFLGVLFGTLIGVLPGIGPVGGMSLLLPLTFKLPVTTAVIMLAGIYYGASYGGSTTSILVNIPGESCSIVTCLDGYQMARKGRAGPALGISAMGSFIGGTLSLIGLMFLAFTLSNQALKFGPPEYFALMCTGLIILTYLTRGSIIKGWVMALIGLFLGTIGQEQVSGKLRFTFGIPELSDGVELVSVTMGLFGISEILINIETYVKRAVVETRIENLFPNLEDWKKSIAPILRGTFIGFFLGILPGGGAVLSSFASYAVEKRISKNPEEFGRGAIEGIAGPETANNSATGGAFIPLLSLGIPSNVVMALILGALLVHGIIPGPLLISKNPDLFWGVIGSMYIGNVMLLILNLPLIGLWVRVLKVPHQILFPLILLFCLLGVYSVNYRAFDLFVLIFSGIVGYILRKLEYEAAPLILALVIGPMLEQAFHQSMIIASGRLSIFIRRPISGMAIAFSLALLISNIFRAFRRAREKVALD